MSRLSSRLLNWYGKNKRNLPWRVRKPDPYAVWVSEVMLQQTRVETVIPYFEKWMRLFPSVRALAKATEQDVLNAWEGLGYYSRARNLHQASKIVVTEHRGKLPRDLDELQSLPGIGRYTVGALASIAFGMDVPALDGNIRRVYARLFDLSEPADSTKGEGLLWALAGKHLPKGSAGNYNQALMDLGATICLPRKPRCRICPLAKLCQSRAKGTQESRPVMKAKKSMPHYVHAAVVIVKRGKVLLAQRPSKGLLGGMWEFPNVRIEGEPAAGLAFALKTAYRLKVRMKRGVQPLVVEHAYTHFKVTVHAFRCEIFGEVNSGLRWVPSRLLGKYPMGKVDRRIAASVMAGLQFK